MFGDVNEHNTLDISEDTNGTIRSRKAKERKHNGTMKTDKQRSTKAKEN